MAAPLEWVFKLTDKMSGPAKAIAESLGKTEAATKATEGATKALETAQSAATSTAKKLEGAQEGVAEKTTKAAKASEGWWDTLKGGLGIVGGVTAGIAGIGFALGRVTMSMFEAAAAQDKMNRAFAGSLGGGGPALQKYLGQVAGSTELTKRQLEALVLPLARQGMGVDQIQKLLPAALDVQARGGDAGVVLEKFAKIASTGKVEDEAFGALNLKAGEALQKIGAQVGLSDVKQVKAAIEAGKISSDLIISGLLSSIAGGGALGDRAVEAARSPAAALNKFKNIQETIFASLAESKALPTLTAALDKFTKVLTSETVINGVSRFFDKLGEALQRVNWDAVASGIEALINLLAKFGIGAAESVGNVASGPTFASRLGRSIEEFTPQFVIARLVAGLFSGGSPVAGAPSANDFVMRADGSVLNISSQDDIIGFKPGGPILSALGGGSGVSVGDIHVHVDGGGSSEDVGARVAESIRRQLIVELDRMSVEAGA